jgi:hypothetical protein
LAKSIYHKLLTKPKKGESEMGSSVAEYPMIPTPRGFSWSGIFAGTFLFLAIEVTFGVLGVAIFASAADPASGHPFGSGITIGVGIWTVVLSIISLYFAGKLASRVSGAATRNMGMHAGFVTFGMCILTAVLVTGIVLGTATGQLTSIQTSTTRLIHVLATGGYWTFVALVLAMISSAIGGMHGVSSGDRRTKSSAADRATPEHRQVA